MSLSASANVISNGRTPATHRGADQPILVIDDDDDLLLAMTAVLRGEGLPVVGAHGGREAEAATLLIAPSLVLLDYRINGEDTGALAGRLRAACGGALPIVLITGDEDRDALAVHVGAAAALAKPFSIDELLGCVARYRKVA